MTRLALLLQHRRQALDVPFMPQETHVGNDQSQGAADVARHRTRGDQIPSGLLETRDASQREKVIERLTG